MASIKKLLSQKAIEIFGNQVFEKITKKGNVFTVIFKPSWNRKIAYDVKNGNYPSWGEEEKFHYDTEKEFYNTWHKFEKEAAIINPEFANGYEDSDRGFVPQNYLFSEFND